MDQQHTPKFEAFAKWSQLIIVEQIRAGLSGHEVLVWGYILSFCNQKSKCAWVSQKTMAGVFGLELHNLCRTLRKLRQKGWLIVKQGSHQSRDLYPVCPTIDIWTGKRLKPKTPTEMEKQYNPLFNYNYNKKRDDDAD